MTQSALPVRAQWPINPPSDDDDCDFDGDDRIDDLRAVIKKIYYMYDNPELVRICADALNGRYEEALR